MPLICDAYTGGGQTLKQLNVEQPIFRTSEISNIKRTNDTLLHYIIFDLKKNYVCLNYSNARNILMIYTRKI